ncbi:MAG TPA: hypothetical protein VLE97_01090, partial [Gaiellaceae bacterium]|nr:hypothetical protein [Gaiellaceae bacterium]
STLVLLPLAIVFGRLWGASGAAGAVLASSAIYAVAWTVLFARIRREPAPVSAPRTMEAATL